MRALSSSSSSCEEDEPESMSADKHSKSIDKIFRKRKRLPSDDPQSPGSSPLPKVKKFKKIIIIDSSSSSEDEKQSAFKISKATARKFKSEIEKSRKLKVVLKRFNLNLLKNGVYKVPKSQIQSTGKRILVRIDLKKMKILDSPANSTVEIQSVFKISKATADKFKSVIENSKNLKVVLKPFNLKLLKNGVYKVPKSQTEKSKKQIWVKIDLKRLNLSQIKTSWRKQISKPILCHKTETKKPSNHKTNEGCYSESKQIKSKTVTKSTKNLTSKNNKIATKKSALKCNSSLENVKTKVKNSLKSLSKKLVSKAKLVNCLKKSSVKTKVSSNLSSHLPDKSTELKTVMTIQEKCSLYSAFDGDIVSKIISESTLALKRNPAPARARKDDESINLDEHDTTQHCDVLHQPLSDYFDQRYATDEASKYLNPRYDTLEFFRWRRYWKPFRLARTKLCDDFKCITPTEEEYIKKADKFIKEYKKSSRKEHKNVKLDDLDPDEIEYKDEVEYFEPIPENKDLNEKESEEENRYNEWNPEDDYLHRHDSEEHPYYRVDYGDLSFQNNSYAKEFENYYLHNQQSAQEENIEVVQGIHNYYDKHENDCAGFPTSSSLYPLPEQTAQVNYKVNQGFNNYGDEAQRVSADTSNLFLLPIPPPPPPPPPPRNEQTAHENNIEVNQRISDYCDEPERRTRADFPSSFSPQMYPPPPPPCKDSTSSARNDLDISCVSPPEPNFKNILTNYRNRLFLTKAKINVFESDIPQRDNESENYSAPADEELCEANVANSFTFLPSYTGKSFVAENAQNIFASQSRKKNLTQ